MDIAGICWADWPFTPAPAQYMDEAYDSIVDVGILKPSGLSQRVGGFQNLSKVVKDVEVTVTVYIVKFHFYFSSKFPLHLDDNFCDSNPNRSDTKSRSWYDALLFEWRE